MSPTIRTFIAIEIADKIRQELAVIQDKLRTANADVKWTEPENIHITLKFLGGTPVDRLPEINSVLDQTANAFHTFDIDIRELSAFPTPNAPRIIWAGIGQGVERIAEITSLIEGQLAQLGFKKEKREFSAHMTLGRARSPKNRALLSRALTEINLPSGLSQKVSRLTFFQSQLTSQGPIYSAIHHSELLQK